MPKGHPVVKVPKYYQVKSEVLALIRDLVPGSALPTERELAERFETSRTTIRQAIAELVVDGRGFLLGCTVTLRVSPRLQRESVPRSGW